jgi:Spy/CpxP family protein refolding chaperone
MSNPNSGPEGDPRSKPSGFGAGARRVLLAGAFAASFLAGGFVMSGAGAWAADTAMSHAMGHGGGHGDMHAMMGAHIDEMLAKLDATPDQSSRIHAIMKDAMTAMGSVHERLAGVHGEIHRLLTAPTIDRGALEQLRAARIADLDQASKVLVQAMADAAEVLTPAQRAKLGTMMAQHQPTH